MADTAVSEVLSVDVEKKKWYDLYKVYLGMKLYAELLNDRVLYFL